MNVESFDILAYLQSRNIPYKTSGKNVSQGWVGVNCIYCIDGSNHLGINLQSKTFSCFKCSETGNAVKLVCSIDGVSVHSALDIISEYSGGTYIPKEKKFQTKTTLPIGASKKFPKSHLDFLIKRRYTEEVIKTYDLYATGPVGIYNHRIIIPVFVNHRMVAFVGRDVTGNSDKPYWNSSDKYGTKDVKQTLYNMDNVIGNTVIIVEGILDAWRIGDGAVCTFGTKHTREQLRLLKGMHRVFVMYDADAVPIAHKLAYDLSSFCKDVVVLELSEGDPDEMKDDDVRALRKEIGI
jgi:DNA primase